MLMVTQNAVAAIDAVVESAPVSDAAGVRISRSADAQGQEGFAISLVEEPPTDDEVLDVEGEHAPLYLEPAAAAALDDKVLDAHLQDDQVAFLLAEQ